MNKSIYDSGPIRLSDCRYRLAVESSCEQLRIVVSGCEQLGDSLRAVESGKKQL